MSLADHHPHAIDVCKSYMGGRLDLARGDTWNEPYVHCAGNLVYTAWADISTGRSSQRVNLYCR